MNWSAFFQENVGTAAATDLEPADWAFHPVFVALLRFGVLPFIKVPSGPWDELTAAGRRIRAHRAAGLQFFPHEHRLAAG